MRPSLRGIDIVDKGIDVFRIGIIVLHRHFDENLVLLSLAVDDLGIKGILSPVQIAHKFLDSALKVKALLLLLSFSFVF